MTPYRIWQAIKGRKNATSNPMEAKMTSLNEWFLLSLPCSTRRRPSRRYAQGITGRTVKIVVPYAAGGTGDVALPGLSARR